MRHKKIFYLLAENSGLIKHTLNKPDKIIQINGII